MADTKNGLMPVRTEFSGGEREQLRKWIAVHGMKNGTITARAYELTQESRSYLLVKGTLILTDGREKSLLTPRGMLLRSILERGAAAGVVELKGIKSKLREVEGFWAHHLGPDQPLAPTRPLAKLLTDARARALADKVKRNFIVYAIKNIATGGIYFGSTVRVKQRWASHRRDLERLSHSNYQMVEDARLHGVASFEFRVVVRFATRKEMLEREQLLIAMYFNRDGCYNLNTSVNPDRAVVGVPLIIVDCKGQYGTHRFLTLHAAIRHYKLSKSKVKEVINAGHGRLGPFRFPIGVPLTAYRTYPVGGRVPEFAKPPKPQHEPKRERPKSYYRRLKFILETQPVTHEELGQILSARTLAMSLWSTQNPPTAPQRALLRLIENFGIEWIRAIPPGAVTAEAVNVYRTKHDLAWFELDDALGLFHGSTQDLAAGEVGKKKVETLLMSILLYYGLDPFFRVHGPPRSALSIVGMYGVRY